jgi:hypothetical protein
MEGISLKINLTLKHPLRQHIQGFLKVESLAAIALEKKVFVGCEWRLHRHSHPTHHHS